MGLVNLRQRPIRVHIKRTGMHEIDKNNLWQRPILMHIKRTVTYGNSWEHTGNINNVRQMPPQMTNKSTNESLVPIIIVKAEPINQMHLPSSDIVAGVLFLWCCFYDTKFLTQNKNKNINEFAWTCTVLKYTY